MWASFLVRSAAVVLLLLASPVLAGGVPATIYRCEIGESITFSDRPCDAGAQRYEPDTSRITTYAPPPAAPIRPAPRAQPHAARKNGSIAAAQAKHAAECARLRTKLDELHSKMRAGYGVREGERLRERKSSLQDRLRANRC